MNPAWSVLGGDIIFTKQIQPPSLLADRFRRLHKISKSSVICSDDYRASKQMLPVFLETKNYPEKVTMGNTIPSLGGS